MIGARHGVRPNGRLSTRSDLALSYWHANPVVALPMTTAAGIRASRYASLRNQMIRAAMSIPANIVEGSGQESRREFGRFLRFAINSASELEYHLIMAKDVGVIAGHDFSSLTTQTVTRSVFHLVPRTNHLAPLTCCWVR